MIRKVWKKVRREIKRERTHRALEAPEKRYTLDIVQKGDNSYDVILRSNETKEPRSVRDWPLILLGTLISLIILLLQKVEDFIIEGLVEFLRTLLEVL